MRRQLIYSFILFFLICAVGNLLAADATVSHTLTLKAAPKLVLKTLRENRIEILEAGGIKVRQNNDKTYTARAGKHFFIIAESVERKERSVIIKWKSTANSENEYNSTIECIAIDDTTTQIKGSVSIGVGNGRIGSNVLRNEINKGIQDIHKEIKKKLRQQKKP